MSKRGENIYKRKDGRWEGRKLVYVPFKKKVSVYGKTYREVRGKLAALTTDSYQPAPQVTVETAVSEWLALKRRQLKESSCVKYRSLAVLHIVPLLGQMPVQKVDREGIVRFVDALTRQSKPGSPGLSPKTVRDILRILREALELRLGRSLFSWDFSGRIPQQKGPRRASVLTAEEQDRLERVLVSSVDPRKCGILLCLYAGFRIGELCALRWRDVDLTNRVVTVSRPLQRLQCPPEWGADGQKRRTKITETPPKSEDSERTVPLAEPLAQQLERLDPHDPDAYVLTGTGAYIEPRSYTNYFKRILKEAQVKPYHFHTLRHTFATRCVESGMDIKSLSEILGHSSVKITLDRYVHPSFSAKQAGINRLFESRQKSWSCL